MNTQIITQAEVTLRSGARAYYERDSSIIPSGFWPAGLIDLALARALPEHKLLRHTGIFCEDIQQPEHRICPEQLLQLIRNIQKHSAADDLSFLFGHALLPGNIAGISEQLAAANNVSELIDRLLEHQALLCPLLNMRRHYEGEQLVLTWHDACGAEEALIFLVETMSTAISSLVRWLCGSRVDWSFYFAHKAPGYIEQYQVHLDGVVHFDCQRNAMSIARTCCYLPWPKTAPAPILQTPQLAISNWPAVPQQGFLTEVYDYLNRTIAAAPNLEQTAADFGMSSASFKRKLKKHRSHFQAIYDQVRKDLAVYWLHQEGWSSEQVARQLHFHDVANLRRAFKKWTGLTPQELRN